MSRGIAVESSTEPIVRTRELLASEEIDKSERQWIIALGVLVVLQLWVGMISTSFWLDETGTWWIVKDGPAEAIHRAFSWSGQSPLFYLIEWAFSRVFGLNEIALRIPSVLAISAATWLLYRIALRLFDRQSAAMTVFLFLCVSSFFAVDARPYALAILCVTAATWALLRWADHNRPLDAAIFVLAGALAIYAHCVLSLGLAAAIAYGVAVFRNDSGRLVRLGLMVLAIVALCLPLAPELLHFYATRSAHTFTGRPGAGEILMGIMPCALIGAVVLVVWTCMVFRKSVAVPEEYSNHKALLAGVWALFAPLFLALLSSISDIHLFVDRYYSCALPGQALLMGVLLASIRPHTVRKALLVVIAAGAIVAQGRATFTSHGNDDWRAAMDLIHKDTGIAPVLMISPFAEGVDFRSVRNPALRDILYSPELFYGAPANPIRLPHIFAAGEHAELENVARQIQDAHRIYLIADKPDRSYQAWLVGRVASRCRSAPLEQSFGYVWVARFVCDK